MQKDTTNASLSPGTLIGRYEIREVLGIGGFGITYKAWDTKLNRLVAMKEYLPSETAVRVQGSSQINAYESRADEYQYGLERFLDEAKTLAKFHHPNIIGVLDHLELNNTAYLIMTYEQGQTLSQQLKHQGGTLPELELKAITKAILTGLQHIHEQDYYHRDIKPGNIYIRKQGEPVLIDFGAARQAIGARSRSLTNIVSTGYAPSEQYGSNQSKQGPWSDLYAVGATMYRCISGQDPSDAPTRSSEIMEGDPDPLTPASKIGQGYYTDEQLQLIDWMLAPAIKNRPQNVSQILARLQKSPDSSVIEEARSTEATELIKEQRSTLATKVVKPLTEGGIQNQTVIDEADYPATDSKIKVTSNGLPRYIVIIVLLLSLLGSFFILPESMQSKFKQTIKEFLPESEADIQAHYLLAIKLEGENRDLASQLAKAEDATQLPEAKALLQKLIYQNTTFSSLKGQQTLTETLNRDKNYQLAIPVLQEVNAAYKNYLKQIKAAEPMFLTLNQLEQVKTKWEQLANKQGYLDLPRSVQLKVHYQQGMQQKDNAELVKAGQKFQLLVSDYEQLRQTLLAFLPAYEAVNLAEKKWRTHAETNKLQKMPRSLSLKKQLHQGRSLESKGDLKAATATYQQLAIEYTTLFNATTNLDKQIKTTRKNQQEWEAIAQNKSSRSKETKILSEQFQQAHKLYQQGDFTESYKAYQQLDTRYRKLLEIEQNYALVIKMLAQSRVDEASDHLNNVLRLEPDNTQIAELQRKITEKKAEQARMAKKGKLKYRVTNLPVKAKDVRHLRAAMTRLGLSKVKVKKAVFKSTTNDKTDKLKHTFTQKYDKHDDGFYVMKGNVKMVSTHITIDYSSTSLMAFFGDSYFEEKTKYKSKESWGNSKGSFERSRRNWKVTSTHSGLNVGNLIKVSYQECINHSISTNDCTKGKYSDSSSSYRVKEIKPARHYGISVPGNIVLLRFEGMCVKIGDGDFCPAGLIYYSKELGIVVKMVIKGRYGSVYELVSFSF